MEEAVIVKTALHCIALLLELRLGPEVKMNSLEHGALSRQPTVCVSAGQQPTDWVAQSWVLEAVTFASFIHVSLRLVEIVVALKAALMFPRTMINVSRQATHIGLPPLREFTKICLTGVVSFPLKQALKRASLEKEIHLFSCERINCTASITPPSLVPHLPPLPPFRPPPTLSLLNGLATSLAGAACVRAKKITLQRIQNLQILGRKLRTTR
ncbi:hypothetical protein TcWFU_008368 [Taenia crassiceps]|uniref:Uncharacterized protein n=1 Tax=Taenia crassiceps TaxID=6207 RepID=A0ABR4QBQ2_9CEST